jgi:hypothetical protein
MEIEEIRKELLQLFRRQMETLDLATFVGMTDVGWREYDERQARIHVLSEGIRLKSAA